MKDIPSVHSPQTGKHSRVEQSPSPDYMEMAIEEIRHTVRAQNEALLNMATSTNGVVDAFHERLNDIEQYARESIRDAGQRDHHDLSSIHRYIDERFETIEDRCRQRLRAEFVAQNKRDVTMQKQIRHGLIICKDTERKVKLDCEDRLQQFAQEVETK